MKPGALVTLPLRLQTQFTEVGTGLRGDVIIELTMCVQGGKENGEVERKETGKPNLATSVKGGCNADLECNAT
jgi:hypothetical protein